jgi:hypothetical protein
MRQGRTRLGLSATPGRPYGSFTGKEEGTLVSGGDYVPVHRPRRRK